MLASIEKVVPDARRCVAAAAPAGALGDRAGVHGLHDVRRPGRGARAMPTARRRCHVVLRRQRPHGSCSAASCSEMLRCIRCGACMNHCPVYCAIGGHAYGCGLSRPDRRGADAGARRHRRRPATCPSLDFLRPLRGGVPGRDPARLADAHWREAALAQPSSWEARGAMLRGWAFVRAPAAALSACRPDRRRQLALLGRGTGRLALAADG